MSRLCCSPIKMKACSESEVIMFSMNQPGKSAIDASQQACYFDLEDDKCLGYTPIYAYQSEWPLDLRLTSLILLYSP